ncbi:hypothetical protein CYY_004533 [Polysphondylium violaceum]|uniref:BTB domain-containing protein n=1 Tax=Polysphondylium violaceum TaxID=133409 RepID=A0A8J4V517_9MYCE|nr:hypothetical protein CYY_004533 [Polysphondylium violaceum]
MNTPTTPNTITTNNSTTPLTPTNNALNTNITTATTTIGGMVSSIINNSTANTTTAAANTSAYSSTSTEHITITILPVGIPIFGLPPFLMKKHTLFRRLFLHVANRFNMDENELLFLFQTRISPDQCPNDIGLVNGDIIVVRSITWKQKLSYESKQSSGSTFVDNIRSLYDSSSYSDICFKLKDDSVLYAHKNILSSRCEKFKVMFKIDMIESVAKELEIKDYEPAVFRKMIEYLYSDDLNEDNVEMVFQLVVIADEYLLDALKKLCESKLISEMKNNNAALFLIQSDRFNCKNLKKASLAYILQNIKKLYGTTDFEPLSDYPTLLAEIIGKMVPFYDDLANGKKEFISYEYNLN